MLAEHRILFLMEMLIQVEGNYRQIKSIAQFVTHLTVAIFFNLTFYCMLSRCHTQYSIIYEKYSIIYANCNMFSQIFYLTKGV